MTTIDSDRKSYQKKLFAFIDLLGFEELVKRSRSNPNMLRTLYASLATSREMLSIIPRIEPQVLDYHPSQWVTHMFSDTIALSSPYHSHDDLVGFASALMIFQYTLWADHGVFLRGAIVYDDIYEEPSVVFGPAVVRAYHLERDKAFWPRVLVDESVLEKLTVEEKARDFAEYLRKDNGDMAYLDYLRDLFHLFTVGAHREPKPKGIIHPLELILRHKIRIAEQVSSIRHSDTEDKERKLCKYLLLSEHHNVVVDEMCRDATHLMLDNVLLLRICMDWTIAAFAGQAYEPVYSAEKLEHVNLMPIVGLAHKKALDELSFNAESSYTPDEFAIELTHVMPKHLGSILDSLRQSKIDCEALLR